MFSEVIPLDSESLKGVLGGLMYEIKIFRAENRFWGQKYAIWGFWPYKACFNLILAVFGHVGETIGV